MVIPWRSQHEMYKDGWGGLTNVISCETPDLAGRTCHRRYSREEQQDDQEGDENASTGVRASDLVDDVDNGIISFLSKN